MGREVLLQIWVLLVCLFYDGLLETTSLELAGEVDEVVHNYFCNIYIISTQLPENCYLFTTIQKDNIQLIDQDPKGQQYFIVAIDFLDKSR